ncbi:MAG: ABC transporter ATP-binding protein [Treponema sp.]|jgi:NitT/TauT family transport system ATP-binding protein|nr:ABC transporter ATP-binding protein [Treponema sp.]
MGIDEETAFSAGNEGIPRIAGENLSFAYSGKPLFENLNFGMGGEGSGVIVILGPSGCGKTTLLKLMAGLLRPDAGSFVISRHTGTAAEAVPPPAASFVFQEPRLLPWKTVLANVTLPAEPALGKAGAEARARHFLRQVSLEEKARAYPAELSGGQKQRVSFARAFTFPGSILLMDEPFQSLDIPLRIQLMDVTRSLLAESPRLAIIVTHDPREAVYLGRRIMILGQPPGGIIFDENLDLAPGDRAFGSAAQSRMEARLIDILTTVS